MQTIISRLSSLYTYPAEEYYTNVLEQLVFSGGAKGGRGEGAPNVKQPLTNLLQ